MGSIREWLFPYRKDYDIILIIIRNRMGEKFMLTDATILRQANSIIRRDLIANCHL